MLTNDVTTQSEALSRIWHIKFHFVTRGCLEATCNISCCKETIVRHLLLRDDARQAGAFLSAATHDDKLIAQLTAHAEARGITKDQYEIQMLYNIREPRQFELAKLGYRVRVYVSYGVNWFPWLMRRLAERPANLLEVMRNVFRG